MYLYEGIEKAERRVRAVLVGCGEQATHMIHNALSYLDEVEIVGVCDMNKERADYAARRLGVSCSYQDLGEMLTQVQADLAVVVTVAGLQAGLARQCVEAGLHVYTEKPLGTEISDLHALQKAAKQHHRKIGVSFNKRYNLAYRDMKRAVESEKFGHPSAFIAKFIGGYRSNETDLLRVGCCHFFDLARYLVGELDEVYAYRYEKQPGQHMFAVTGKFENGCVANMTFGSLGSWVCGYGMEQVEVRGDRNMVSAENGRDFLWQKPSKLLEPAQFDQSGKYGRTGEHCRFDVGLENRGTQAVSEQAVPVEILRPNYSNLGKLALKDFYINGNYQCLKAFAASILNDTEPPVGYADGLMALKLALAVEKSVAEHRAVRIDEIVG